jgi:hypothetical protein
MKDLTEARAGGYTGTGATLMVDWQVSATVEVDSS